MIASIFFIQSSSFEQQGGVRGLGVGLNPGLLNLVSGAPAAALCDRALPDTPAQIGTGQSTGSNPLILRHVHIQY
jgi:hypothetical protein